ncbi:MAG: exodeoxyribonuclease VII small subunit [Actinobacteria bacterium]|nr:MAG: exodeoxyribonuclease VII small subunit [Actinomycetota bacterium]
MAEESYGFTATRARLEEIVSQVRKKDTSLEKSLDLLEEGVRLANQCTELIDHADWDAAAGVTAQDGDETGVGPVREDDATDKASVSADGESSDDAAADVADDAGADDEAQ